MFRIYFARCTLTRPLGAYVARKTPLEPLLREKDKKEVELEEEKSRVRLIATIWIKFLL